MFAYLGATFAISAAKGGLKFWEQEQKYDEMDRAAKKKWQDKKREVSIYNQQEQARVNRTNEYITKVWNQKLANYRQQVQFNQEAAFRGYIGEQLQDVDAISAFMFEQTDLLAELTREAGTMAARGFTSRSAQLAEAKDVQGAYYRAVRMSANNLGRELEETQGAMEQIARQQYQANLAAHADVAVQPLLETFRPITAPQKPSGIRRNSGLRIGSVLADAALDTALAAAPAIGRGVDKGAKTASEIAAANGPAEVGAPMSEGWPVLQELPALPDN